jgi:kinesin family protein 1
LSSPRILDEHCALINENSKVTIRPLSEAAILVNGKPIPTNTTTQLESGFRIIIDWHVFRFSSPESVRAQRMKESASFSGELCDAVADDVALSETSRDLGPVNVVDWSFARKEALSRLALRGEDLDTLDDDELDELFQDITRARTERKRPDSQTGTPSRLRNITTFDTESVPDVNVRQLVDVDKDDNPWIVNPSGHSNLSDRVPAQLFSESIERSESESSWSAARRLKHAPQGSMEVSRMAEEIRRLRQITLQNRFESLSSRLDGVMNDRDKSLTSLAITRWRKLCIVGMARTMRDKTDSVVEANMLAKRQGIDIHYRIIATSGTPVSSLEPHVESVLFDAEATHTVTRSSPSVAVLVVDLSKSLSYTWSFEKLDRQLLMMRAITKDKQSAHEPNHKSAFVTLPYPRFTHLGSAMFALHPRATGNMTVPIQCCVDADAIGTLEADVSWQQTTNQVDVRDKFFTVTVSLAQVRAFTSDVDRAHMQLRVPVFGIGGKRESVYTSKNIDLPGGSSSQLRLKETFQLAASAFQEQLYVVVDFFGEVERLYLERLLNRIPYIPASPNDNETRRSAGDVTIKHTLAIHLAILELNSQGEFTPTEFDRNDQVFLLRQGRQRHLEIRILHDSARALDFKDVVFITIKSQQASESAIIHLTPLKDPSTIYHPDGRGELRVVCKLEDVTGMEKKMNGTESLPCQLSFQVGFEGYNAPALFVQSLRVRILGRESRRRSSLMDYLRVKSFGPDMSRIFQIVLPDESRSQITGSQVAIIASYLERRHRQHLVADVQSMKALLTTVQPITHVHGKSRDEQQRAVSLCVKAWQSRMETTVSTIELMR